MSNVKIGDWGGKGERWGRGGRKRRKFAEARVATKRVCGNGRRGRGDQFTFFSKSHLGRGAGGGWIAKKVKTGKNEETRLNS